MRIGMDGKMKDAGYSAILVGAYLLAAVVAIADEPVELSAREIVRRSDELLRGEESYAKITMEIVRARWSRKVEMEGWTKGTEEAFIRILSAKEKGVAFLKKGREAWQYVPTIDRVIKLPPSMMLQSWLGSDFTNDDVVRADSLVVDYEHRIVSEFEGNAGWVIEAIPLPLAPVVWSKVVFRIRRADYIAERMEFFDEDGVMVKFCTTDDVRSIEGRNVAMRLEMHDAIESGNKTVLTYGDLTFSPKIESDTFSTKHLRE